MKKFLLLVLLLLSSILYTGCAKNYKTVSEYAEDMAIVKNRAGSYRIEAVVTTDDADTYCNSFIKGDKWKTETSKNSGKSRKIVFL